MVADALLFKASSTCEGLAKGVMHSLDKLSENHKFRRAAMAADNDIPIAKIDCHSTLLAFFAYTNNYYRIACKFISSCSKVV